MCTNMNYFILFQVLKATLGIKHDTDFGNNSDRRVSQSVILEKPLQSQPSRIDCK